MGADIFMMSHEEKIRAGLIEPCRCKELREELVEAKRMMRLMLDCSPDDYIPINIIKDDIRAFLDSKK